MYCTQCFPFKEMIGFYENFKHAFWIKNITTNIRAFGLKLKEIQTHFYIKADT